CHCAGHFKAFRRVTDLPWRARPIRPASPPRVPPNPTQPRPESLMAAEHRDDPVTRETVFRTYPLPEDLRAGLGRRRHALGHTLPAPVASALAPGLPGLVRALRDPLPVPGGSLRPIRLPLTQALLNQLRDASDQTGIPATRLLIATLARAAARKRRRK